jgi:hypothetical protein
VISHVRPPNGGTGRSAYQWHLSAEGVAEVMKIVEVRSGQLPPVGTQSTALLAA